jgi:hypothetical protein
MSRASWFPERRRKESFALLVVNFLRSYLEFEGVYADFKRIEGEKKGFEGSGLFERIRRLEEQVVFDVKEKAHTLFRVPAGGSPGVAAPGFAELERVLLKDDGGEADREQTRRMFSALRRSLVSRSLDSYIGTGFHMFMILRESLYQLEFYAPMYAQELEQAQRIIYLTQRVGHELDEEAEHELTHIRRVAELCQTIAGYSRDLAGVAIERCRSLLRETAEVIRHSVEESSDNEILVLNLLRERALIEQVYGPGSSEEILAHMFRHDETRGGSGSEKALAFAMEKCGNIEALLE